MGTVFVVMQISSISRCKNIHTCRNNLKSGNEKIFGRSTRQDCPKIPQCPPPPENLQHTMKILDMAVKIDILSFVVPNVFILLQSSQRAFLVLLCGSVREKC